MTMFAMWAITVLMFAVALVCMIVAWHVTRDVCEMQARLQENKRHGDILLFHSWRDMSPFKKSLVRREDPHTYAYAEAVARARQSTGPMDERRRLAAALIAASVRTEQVN